MEFREVYCPFQDNPIYVPNDFECGHCWSCDYCHDQWNYRDEEDEEEGF